MTGVFEEFFFFCRGGEGGAGGFKFSISGIFEGWKILASIFLGSLI